MAVQRRGNVKTADTNSIEKKIKRGIAQRQASSYRGYAALLIAFIGSCALPVWLWSVWTNDITDTMVSREEVLAQPRVFMIQCSEDYQKYKHFPGCTPSKCGRAVTDNVVSADEAQALKRIAERGLALGGSDGGASILDLHSGALSMGKKFVNIYRTVRSRIQRVICETFGLDSSKLYLTKPTFFSRINSTSAKTTHDEYWHPHIDKVTYGSFDYTSLLYLTDYGVDFGGGRFIFMDPNSNRTVEPRTGSENLHHVEKVAWGTRYAITVSFTCDPDFAIADPSLP
ncbi:2-oxoglutarate and iron-dependent oxygenase domain-containing protein 3 [Bagarius yarrelli]|uniref:2-oxoglutarate and iron-dependent oxygenase domain-containing protein 3 n=1 Tax=Bagarius yarrelli TaxID=175774 RepID=A0A556TJ04_BAGYA|nr:2-oxoglutarate and iron-dependent oxygenase domain-containing protein 3 [Bagarius yarrelli]